MSDFRKLWAEGMTEKGISKDVLSSYIKRLAISAGIPSKVLDSTRAQKTPDSSAVGTAYGGPIPTSLLARQDLEATKTFIIKDGSDHDLTIEIHNGSEETAKAVFEGCELSAITKLESYMGNDIFMTPEMADTDGKMVGCYCVIGQDMSLQVFFSLKDARDFIDSVMVTNKGQVEETKKDLIGMAQEAQDGEIDSHNFVRSVKAVQLRRQKATTVAREREMGTKKSFGDSWKAFSKMGFQAMAMYCVKVLGPGGTYVFDRYGLTFDDMEVVLENARKSYKGHVIEVSNDMGYREVYAPK